MLETNQTSVVLLTDILEHVSTELDIPFKAVKEAYMIASGYEQWSGMDYICIPTHVLKDFMDTHMLRELAEAEDSVDPLTEFGYEWYNNHTQALRSLTIAMLDARWVHINLG